MLQAYEHRIKNNTDVPLRVELRTAHYTAQGHFRPSAGDVVAQIDLAPGQEQRVRGNAATRIGTVFVTYRGADPRFSGLRIAWHPRGTPPVATDVQIALVMQEDPDTITASGGKIARLFRFVPNVQEYQ